MKHIKLYEAFDDSNEVKDIIQNIKDICIELQDEGYMVNVYSMNNADKKEIKIGICYKIDHEFMAFEYIEVKEVFERIINYVGNKSSRYEIEATPDMKNTLIVRRYNNWYSSKKFPEDNMESRQFNLILTL